MPAAPPSSRPESPPCGGAGFSLVEVVIAIALFATVLLGMLALLANGVSTRSEVRRDTLAVQICHQVHQALRGYRLGVDDQQAAPTGNIPGLLDEFLPFDFAKFPGDGKPAFVLGFDAEGQARGKNLASEYEDGSQQDRVTFLTTLEGKPVIGKPGMTEVIIGVEHPATVPRAGRHRKEFRVLMTPRAEDNPDDAGGQP